MPCVRQETLLLVGVHKTEGAHVDMATQWKEVLVSTDHALALKSGMTLKLVADVDAHGEHKKMQTAIVSILKHAPQDKYFLPVSTIVYVEITLSGMEIVVLLDHVLAGRFG